MVIAWRKGRWIYAFISPFDGNSLKWNMRKLTVQTDSLEINFEWTDSNIVMITTKTKIWNSRLKKQICMHIVSNWEIRNIGFSRNGLIFGFFVESHLAEVFCWLKNPLLWKMIFRDMDFPQRNTSARWLSIKVQIWLNHIEFCYREFP